MDKDNVIMHSSNMNLPLASASMRPRTHDKYTSLHIATWFSGINDAHSLVEQARIIANYLYEED